MGFRLFNHSLLVQTSRVFLDSQDMKSEGTLGHTRDCGGPFERTVRGEGSDTDRNGFVATSSYGDCRHVLLCINNPGLRLHSIVCQELMI